MASRNKPPIFMWLGLQLAFIALVVAGVWVFETRTGARPHIWMSCLFGGLVAVIPHTYFAGLAWRQTGARAARAVVNNFYRGESGRFILTLVGFGLIFVSPLSVQPLALFVTYALTLALQIGLAARFAR